MKKYIDRIIELRKSKSLMQKQIADKLGMTQVSYSKIETEKTELTLDRLFKIADILEVNVIELINPDFNPTNFSKELQEENINLKNKIEEKNELIEMLKNEKSHIKQHLVMQMLSNFSSYVSSLDDLIAESKEENIVQKLVRFRKNTVSMFVVNRNIYVNTGFLSQSDFDNHYKEMEGIYIKIP